MSNLAEMLVRHRESGAMRPFGLIEQPGTYGEFHDRANRLAATLSEHAGVAPGRRIAVIGNNCDAYLDLWLALQMCGAEAVLINPTYPSELLTAMLADIDPASVVWVNNPARPECQVGGPTIEIGESTGTEIVIDGFAGGLSSAPGDLPGLRRRPEDIAGYMHTSGTSGRPKFCAQSQDYFLRMAKYLGDRMALTRYDTVFAPLPLFHINPLGYGVITSLFSGAGVLSATRFSASQFWTQVVGAGVTTLIMHAPPIEILNKTSTARDSAGHKIRYCFYANAEFLERFDIPLAQSGYGSTEVGGVSHSWLWRRGDVADVPEGMSHYGGTPRPDIEYRLSTDGEIEIRGVPRTALFSGYQKGGERTEPFDADGWFATGDLGRIDENGSLVFIERNAESLRVSGEYVPISFVERHFSQVAGVEDVAIWRDAARVGDSDVVVIFVAGGSPDSDALREACGQLPKFMRPQRALRIERIPRDPGVGKVRRRELNDLPVLSEFSLA